MRWHTRLLIALVVGSLLVPAAAAAPAADQRATSAASPSAVLHDDSTAPPDPANDTLGWENGYWYNESLPGVDPSDGFNETELDKVVARSMARVERVRQLEFEKTVPVNLVGREAYKERYASDFNVSNSFRLFDNTKLEAMFFVSESTDAVDIREGNRGATVGGFYSPSEERIVVVSENSTSPRLSEITLSQELFHALQDQVFNFSVDYSTRESHNADDGIIEGDGNLVDRLYQQRCEQEWNCFRDQSSDSGGSSSLPADFNWGLYFLQYQPYSDGPKFVAQVKARGGWEAVNELYENPPASSAEVIDPDTYGGAGPRNVSLADRTTDDWQRVTPPGRRNYAAVGQPGIASMFIRPTYHEGKEGGIVDRQEFLNLTDSGVSSFDPINYGFAAAEGWDGDKMYVYRNAQNQTGYVWRIAWESDAEAAEFRETYQQLLEYWGVERVGQSTYRITDDGFADAIHVAVDGDTVTIVNAPTVAALSSVHTNVTVRDVTETPTTAEPSPTPTPAGDGRTASPTPGGDGASDETPTATATPAPDETATRTPGLGALVAVAGLLLALAGLAVRRR
ncbi:MAG: Hvo_1808 family surface protein [Halobaculum sp.]